jgi:hypothetical protein
LGSRSSRATAGVEGASTLPECGSRRAAQEIWNVLQTQRTVVTQHVCFAIKFGATVDERCDADKVKIAAEIVVIQNRATLANSTD